MPEQYSRRSRMSSATPSPGKASRNTTVCAGAQGRRRAACAAPWSQGPTSRSAALRLATSAGRGHGRPARRAGCAASARPGVEHLGLQRERRTQGQVSERRRPGRPSWTSVCELGPTIGKRVELTSYAFALAPCPATRGRGSGLDHAPTITATPVTRRNGDRRSSASSRPCPGAQFGSPHNTTAMPPAEKRVRAAAGAAELRPAKSCRPTPPPSPARIAGNT